jgi:hypothetical protein
MRGTEHPSFSSLLVCLWEQVARASISSEQMSCVSIPDGDVFLLSNAYWKKHNLCLFHIILTIVVLLLFVLVRYFLILVLARSQPLETVAGGGGAILDDDGSIGSCFFYISISLFHCLFGRLLGFVSSRTTNQIKTNKKQINRQNDNKKLNPIPSHAHTHMLQPRRRTGCTSSSSPVGSCTWPWMGSLPVPR